jgi:hypothetical protein
MPIRFDAKDVSETQVDAIDDEPTVARNESKRFLGRAGIAEATAGRATRT